MAGKRAASVADATPVLAAPVKKLRTKVASIFGTTKKPVPSPISTVTTRVTSTPAVIEAAPSSLSTSTILSDDPSGAPSSSGSPDADDRGATPGLQDVASARDGAFAEAPDQQTTGNNAEESRPRAVQKDSPTPEQDGTVHAPQVVARTRGQDRAGAVNNQSVTSPLVDKHASASEPPMHKTISAAPADSSESDTFVYPSITAPASQDKSDPIPATGSPHSTFPGDDLAADQHAACLQGGTSMPAKIPAEAAEASRATDSAPGVSKGKKTTAYSLCRQNFERAHPGVDKKSMTALFKSHWKQMGAAAKKEWDEKARLANSSQAQAAQASSSA
ncbi:hypothetical protein K525DRAFT_281526 [Schizophyllum commune Loenen D]|nr:hypothetical protein K525DRAFT_281526 [Schizophyllum commune Loenen D]